MPAVPGLRSPYAMVDRLIYVGRMFDKIRLHSRGELPAEYHAALGNGLDLRACTFLQVEYTFVQQCVLTGDADEIILAHLLSQAGARSHHDCMLWSRFLAKLGWRDDRSEFLRRRVADSGWSDQGICTFFDLIEFDEGRPLDGYAR